MSVVIVCPCDKERERDRERATLPACLTANPNLGQVTLFSLPSLPFLFLLPFLAPFAFFAVKLFLTARKGIISSMTTPVRRLQGPTLWLARAAWLLLVTASLVTFAVSVPLGYELYQVPCNGDGCLEDQLNAQGVAALE